MFFWFFLNFSKAYGYRNNKTIIYIETYYDFTFLLSALSGLL